jgi:hypothetical protein
MDRADLAREGEQVKTDVFNAIFGVQNVISKLEPDAYFELLADVISCYGAVVRAQVLESVAKNLEVGSLTPDTIDKAISFLCRRVDATAASLGNKLMLIQEVQQAPEARN